MKHVIKGIVFSFLFGLCSIALAALAYGYLNLESWWIPIFWPALIYSVTGFPVLFLLDQFPVTNQFLALFFPEGGASGVFGSILITSFLIWSLIFGALSKYMHKRKTNKRAPA